MKKKTAKNILYSYSAEIYISVLGIITTIFMIRLLSPFDFGLVALGGILMSVLRQFQTLGIQNSIIQRDKSEVNNLVFSTGFVFSLVLSVTLFLLTYITAPFWAELYNQEELTDIVRFTSLNFLISTFAFVPDVKLQRKLDFKNRVKPDILMRTVRSIISITLAFNGFSYWSLIIADLFSNIVRVFAFNFLSPWKLSLSFDRLIAKDLFQVGKWFTLAGIIFGLYTIIDNAIIGLFFVPSILGSYVIAYRWSHLISDQITNSFSKVLFPTFSKIRNDKAKLERAFTFAIKYSSLVCFPISLGIVALGDKFIYVIGGSEWADSITPLRILALASLIRCIQRIDGTLLNSTKLHKYNTIIILFNSLLIFTAVYYTASNFGINEVCISLVLIFLISKLISSTIIQKYLGISYFSQFKHLFIPAFSSTIMYSVLYYSQNVFDGFNLVTEFILLVFSGFIIYSLVLLFLTRGKIVNDFDELKSFIFN